MSDLTEPTPTLKKRKVAISAAIAEATRVTTTPDSDSDSPDSTPMALNTSALSGDLSYDNIINKKPARVREKRSEVWRYFEVQEITNNGQSIRIGKCKNCPYYGKYSSSTSFMKDHLRKCKGIVYSGGNLNSSFHDGDTLQEAEVKAEDNTGADLNTSSLEYKPRKSRLSALKPNSELNFAAIWEYVNDTRRAKYPKALNALLEDLGVFEVGDLKSLDYDQFEILGSLLKPAPQKSFNELIFR